ncbi:MAG: hypothetical protein V1914_04200 [archaeon]
MEGFKTIKDTEVEYLINHIIGFDSYKVSAGTIYIPEKLLILEPDRKPRKASKSDFEWIGILPLRSSSYDKPKCPKDMVRVHVSESDIEKRVRDYERKVSEARSKNTLRELLK